MPDIRKVVGRRTRVLRKKLGYTQEELARRAEIARESLSRIERGQSEVGLYVLQRLGRVDVHLERITAAAR
jgi:transcriptional regulator with XRE-family HTH domain